MKISAKHIETKSNINQNGFFVSSRSKNNFFNKSSIKNTIQPKLKVEDDYPQSYVNELTTNLKGDDLSKAMSNAERLNHVRKQLKKLSPHFTVGGSGEVKPNHKLSETQLVNDKKGVASCCLHLLTRPQAKEQWEIFVLDHLSPHTNQPDKESKKKSKKPPRQQRKVVIPSPLNPITYGAHNVKGEKQSYDPKPELILGHELCGHAALTEIGVHAEGARATTNVHDSTINVENAIAEEQGVPKDQLRGLASDGSHKGESFGEMEVVEFGFNKHSINKLPESEKEKLTMLSDLIKRFDFYVEIRGHSDNVGSERVKQNISDRRAKSVFRFLRNLGVSLKATETLKVDSEGVPTKKIKINRFAKKGMSDKEPRKGVNIETEQHKLRRVDVIISGVPAGLSELPKGVSKKNKAKLASVEKIKTPNKATEILDDSKGTKGTPCEKLLVGKAFK